jgi:general secretion pathway protein B
MSSILEALERAEEERNRSNKKTSFEPVTHSPGLLQRRELWLALAALLFINLLLWWWLIKDEDYSHTIVPDSATQQRLPVDASETTTSVVSMLKQSQLGDGGGVRIPPLLAEARDASKPLNQAVVTPPAKTAAVTPPKSVSPSLDEAQQTAHSVAVDPAEPRKPVAAQGITNTNKGQKNDRPQNTTPVEVEAAQVMPAPRETLDPLSPGKKVLANLPGTDDKQDESAQAEAKRADSIIVSEPTPVAEKEPDEQIPMLWESPSHLREKLADLKINIHVFNEEPSQRFVIINMRRYKEGDRLEKYDMALERITREGIVINHGNGLVRF